MVAGTIPLTSAQGIISLLDENQTELKVFALSKLDQIVDEFWAEISEAIEKIEILYEDQQFPHRKLAALVASKVYYHLGSFKDSLDFALQAEDLFDINSTSEFVQTIISKAIDDYTEVRQKNAASGSLQAVRINPQLEAIVNKMFERCLEHGQFRQAVGIALETRRMDVFEKAIKQSDDVSKMLQHSLRIAMTLIQNRSFRDQVLRVLVILYKGLEQPDYINMVQCLISLDDAPSTADVLVRLVRSVHKEQQLMAYQIAFDLYESGTQQFLIRVIQALRGMAPTKSGEAPPPTVEESKDKKKPGEIEKTGDELLDKLIRVLSGELTIGLHLQFLIRSNHSDLLILKQTKEAVRNSICHTATVIANALMHCGTTSDAFLRDNLDWLARATNWAKFTAVSSLGVIHKGHEKESLQLMGPYLPKESTTSSGYTEGGGLYALGLIHAHHGAAIIDYLVQQLKDAQNEIIRHGACLGVGLAAMCTHRADVYEQLKFNLYQDDAVTGEAAGVGMGLVMLGSGAGAAIDDMVVYAKETQHEKILRGLAVGIAFVMFGRMEQADSVIDTLASDKDPLLRRSAMHTIAMAYCGSENNASIKKLLHFAVSDVNDDVRRAAVEALGFLLIRTPEQCPSVVSLLSESYNPNVRYGSAMALGISCAGTGNKEALALLEPMTNDPVNFVRQGALVATALVLIQQSEVVCPKVKELRSLYQKVIADKHEDVMAKFGAIIAQGIIDAGGRNVTAGLLSRTGHVNIPAIVGMLGFTQFWYWFPFSHFLSLAFTPSCVIGLNSSLAMPKIEFRSNVKPSTYAYPPPLEEKKEKEREKVMTAVLSITFKAAAKKRQREKAKEEGEDKMDVDDKDVKAKEEADAKIKEDAEAKAKEEEKKPEPNFEILANPARVVRPQLKVIQMNEGARYRPVKDVSIGGVILMLDTKSEQDEELVEPVVAGGLAVAQDEQEPEPPEPFEYEE
ncbi:26S proteasome non-ATPase regulatory subunit 1-like [Varroa jacobsoni]|uniref:26S proteasome non-ATPase regulatory subunit 1 n=1 Tax=Varroa destructor TaxID=109461 RepID=A0A7M7JI30_VARDE|nr:26S proteasome non-ATPase regulatory subunit 1-like [Varroa destructor]XP_022688220.1 26S proteasome non-ATPase regulatory subunit 1-like [Varroa jacobsoni]